MTQPTPNHRPPGSAAPRLVDDLRDIELLARVSKRTQLEQSAAEFERDVLFTRQRVGEWYLANLRRERRAMYMRLLILALGLAVAIYAIDKTQAGAGL